MTQKSKSWQIEPNRIDNLVQQVRSSPQSEILECKSKYEVLRARMDGKLVIVYSSGKVVYHDSPKMLAMLSKYGKAATKARKKKELKPINMKMNEEQKAALNQALALIAEPAETPGEYEEAAFTLDGAKITIYSTGSVYSPHGHPQFEDAIINIIKEYPIYPQYDIIIGQDEVGKGEIFGPMIVGSVAVTQDEAVALQFAGVKDSKELSTTRIEELAESIKRKSIARRTITIQARRFNKLFEKFKEEDKTLNDLLAWAHFKALEEVLLQLDKKGKQDAKMLVIIDEFSRVSTDKRLRKLKEERRFDLIQTPRAESLSASVAAASILAKAHRNSDMEDLKEIINLPLDRKNLQTIIKHPRAPEVVRYSYIEKIIAEVPTPNTIMGLEANAFLDQILLQSSLETYDIDFKSEFPQNATKIGKLIAGMANCDGGDIYFGILQDSDRDSNEIVGIKSIQKVEERALGQANKCDPCPKVECTLFTTIEGKNVLRVQVPVSDKRVYFEGKFFKRVGSRTEQMTRYDIENWPESCRSI